MPRMHHCLTCDKDYQCTSETICKMARDTDDCGDCYKVFDKRFPA